MSHSPQTRKRLRLAGLFLALGLAVQVASLTWTHPVAFMSFLGVGCGLVALGMVIFLLA